ncbi:glutathione S-transferase family protein [Uliginosibacterium aquaticum]|uniref:Glutathione S-transferase n=1 Tax=Uliginosibacterium aquaticum TaxID=2731212 RepID=A0ABX2IIA0_9RHOO|nr:glutathione S-transferase [Uliginosibacterium aquaticum]NSL56465.1 glutathione S-transferase [Uliginosibacterium aquaticum]
MITVHHLEMSRSQRILWLLEELGLPYELVIHARDPATRLAPPELRKIHPLGKSPVIQDGDLVIAESGAILEYLAEVHGVQAKAELAGLEPKRGSAAGRECRFWMHYAEGSLMNWLVMKLVFTTIPRQPMPFFVRPIARGLCNKVIEKLIEPNLERATAFIDEHLASHTWFAGQAISLADFQMCFALEALSSRSTTARHAPHIKAWLERVRARPAYQRAIEKGGPVLPQA